MKVDQLIKHYGSPTAVKNALGYTLQTLRNWKRDGIPEKAQAYIQWLTNGQFKAKSTGKKTKGGA